MCSFHGTVACSERLEGLIKVIFILIKSNKKRIIFYYTLLGMCTVKCAGTSLRCFSWAAATAYSSLQSAQRSRVSEGEREGGEQAFRKTLHLCAVTHLVHQVANRKRYICSSINFRVKVFHACALKTVVNALRLLVDEVCNCRLGNQPSVNCLKEMTWSNKLVVYSQNPFTLMTVHQSTINTIWPTAIVFF